MMIAFFKLIFELMWPVKTLISLIIRTSWNIIWTTLTLPFTLLSLLYNGFLGFFQFFKSFFSSVNNVSQASTDAKETFSMIAYATSICIQWSQSITNKVIRAFKAVYDFIVYVGCEIGKHNYTI